MKPVLTPDQMRAMEARCFAEGIATGARLMDNAARALLGAIAARFPGAPRVGIACGPGNNGGDGYALARMLAGSGARVHVLPVSEVSRGCPDALANRRAVEERNRIEKAEGSAGVTLYGVDEAEKVPEVDVWVDAMFGTGLARALTGAALSAARRMARDRARGAFVLAADVPSGLDARTGDAGKGDPVCADATVCFGALKTGLLLGDGRDLCGELTVGDIGIPATLLPGDAAQMMELSDAYARLAPRRRNSYKNQYGHLLVIAGSRGMAGAAMLCARAALRAGAGLVTVACPESLLPIVQTRVPCAMAIPLPEREGVLCEAAMEPLSRALAGKTALAVGPGLSQAAHAGVVRLALTCGLPAVLDADALNILARERSLFELLGQTHLLTPHPGECARLLGRAPADALDGARALEHLGCVGLLKGVTTVVAHRGQSDAPMLKLLARGTPGMATGGSGDVLTGIAGARLAQGEDAADAAWLSAMLHARAGELCAARFSETAMTAWDMVDMLPDVFLEAERARGGRVNGSVL